MNQPRDTEALAIRATGGDRVAFAALLEEVVPDVRRFLFRLGTPVRELDDMTQEVFLAVIRGFGAFRGEARFTTWLFGVALRIERGRRRRRRQTSTGPVEIVDRAIDPARSAALRDDAAALLADLERLPDPLREAFVLRHVEERPVAEAARILAIPEGTVRRHAHEARVRLAQVRSHAEAERR